MSEYTKVSGHYLFIQTSVLPLYFHTTIELYHGIPILPCAMIGLSSKYGFGDYGETSSKQKDV